ncbi:MAG: 1-acyl-sn-glycerol-3-phosphate acyltransferase [Arcicella sp.]|nr:1-acyl-sn-glycerol-3-phosphate acyltransferase [Arcicella sp.]
MLKIIGKLILQLAGYKIIDTTPKGVQNYQKAVMIAAPHTSNWDYVYTMAALYALDVPIKYLGKASLFKFPLGFLIKKLGGVPVKREQKNNMVNDMAKMINDSIEQIILIIPAEGTRSYSKEWKSGFYHIAQTAGIPIILGFLDFGKKKVGFLDEFNPTGNYENDLKIIQKKYVGITPRYPELNSLKNVKFD